MKLCKCGQPAFKYNNKVFDLCAVCIWNGFAPFFNHLALHVEFNSGWYDAVDHSPALLCDVELPDGQIIEAHYVCGSWETKDGQSVNPLRFHPKKATVTTALYKSPFEI